MSSVNNAAHGTLGNDAVADQPPEGGFAPPGNIALLVPRAAADGQTASPTPPVVSLFGPPGNVVLNVHLPLDSWERLRAALQSHVDASGAAETGDQSRPSVKAVWTGILRPVLDAHFDG